MPRERILITVKTYPTVSSSYGELVCTAGLREDGSWIRIYPVPFRQLKAYKKFEKYRIVDALVVRNDRDVRPESHKVDLPSFGLTEVKLSTNKGTWRERREWVLGRSDVHDDLTELIAAANDRNELSLATFRPGKILDFVAEPQESQWNKQRLDALKEASKQEELFSDWTSRNLTDLVRKLPWKFSYKLRDSQGTESKMMIADWEIGELYWNCLKSSSSAEEAVAKVRKKYLNEFTEKDLHLFLGTTLAWHGRGSNPFIIVGVFYPPFQAQGEFNLN